MTTKRRKRHTPEQIVRKLRDAEAMLNPGKELPAVLQSLGVSDSTYQRWLKQYGGMKAEGRADMDILMSKDVAEGNL